MLEFLTAAVSLGAVLVASIVVGFVAALFTAISSYVRGY